MISPYENPFATYIRDRQHGSMEKLYHEQKARLAAMNRGAKQEQDQSNLLLLLENEE